MSKLLKFYQRKAVEYLEKYFLEKENSDMWYNEYKLYFDKYLECLDMKDYWKKGFVSLSCLCVGLVVLLFYFMYLLSC